MAVACLSSGYPDLRKYILPGGQTTELEKRTGLGRTGPEQMNPSTDSTELLRSAAKSPHSYCYLHKIAEIIRI